MGTTRVRNSTRGLHRRRTCALRWCNIFFPSFFFYSDPRHPAKAGDASAADTLDGSIWLELFPWANTGEVQCYVTRMYRCEKSTYLTRYAIRCLDSYRVTPVPVYRSTYARLASASPDIYTGGSQTRFVRLISLVPTPNRTWPFDLLVSENKRHCFLRGNYGDRDRGIDHFDLGTVILMRSAIFAEEEKNIYISLQSC